MFRDTRISHVRRGHSVLYRGVTDANRNNQFSERTQKGDAFLSNFRPISPDPVQSIFPAGLLGADPELAPALQRFAPNQDAPVR
jgi:hypothetical protein